MVMSIGTWGPCSELGDSCSEVGDSGFEFEFLTQVEMSQHSGFTRLVFSIARQILQNGDVPAP